MPVRGARRQGRPAHRAAPPARGCRGRQQRHVARRGKPGKWPGRRSSAARAGGLVGPVNRRCSSRGAFAQHGSQVPAVPPQGVKCRTRCMQSTNPQSKCSPGGPVIPRSRRNLFSFGGSDNAGTKADQWPAGGALHAKEGSWVVGREERTGNWCAVLMEGTKEMRDRCE